MTFRQVYTSTGAEPAVVIHGRLLPGGVPVIFCHGLLVGAVQSLASEGRAQRLLADLYETTSAGADLGGLATWGNTDAVDAVDDLITWLGANYGTDTARVALYGTSMGGATALNWAMRNPSKVVAVALSAPVVDLEGIHDRDPLGLSSSIEDAYGGEAGYLAALPDHDPSHPNNAVVTRQLGPRTRIWYSTDDNVIAASEVLAYGGVTGCELTSVGAVGHSLTEAGNQGIALWLAERVG